MLSVWNSLQNYLTVAQFLELKKIKGDNMLNHLEFDTDKFRFSLTGSVLTVFCLLDGLKVRQYYYSSKDEARAVFLAIAL